MFPINVGPKKKEGVLLHPSLNYLINLTCFVVGLRVETTAPKYFSAEFLSSKYYPGIVPHEYRPDFHVVWTIFIDFWGQRVHFWGSYHKNFDSVKYWACLGMKRLLYNFGLKARVIIVQKFKIYLT